ncbi:MAG: tetratricopeptide repeat protein [Caldilineaceae bacterium]
MRNRPWLRLGPWPRHVLALAFILLWALVIHGLPPSLPLQVTSWLTFLALLVTPGYLLTEVIAWRTDLDWIERLALAFPVSVAVLALPGLAALLLHRSMAELATGWIMASGLAVGIWFIHLIWRRRGPGVMTGPWRLDEWLMLGLIAAGFAAIVPVLNIYKIDGDAYAVSSFAADALAGLPLNATEPIFGTALGAGVRMAFNQSLPMMYLWSWFGHIDPITLTSTASRTMIALWSLFAAYTLGRAAGLHLPGGGNGRRFGLFVAALQLLIYLAAPFLRGDNVSIFFFERTTADKFMVPITMVPVVIAMTMRYLGSGRGTYWALAGLVSFAVSTIHPLIAAMLALALGAFGLVHWLLNLRSRQTFLRALSIGGLLVIVMALPMVQLVMSRGEAPLAASYPTSLEGWPVGHRLVPALPYLYMPTLDVYGPLPDMARLDASEADSITNPFLIWRFAVNMERRRLILFDLDHYISDPNLVLEPPYLLAILLLPLLLWRLRTNLGAQFALSTTLAVIFVMFNPFVTPLIGDLVMPWILWRFVWLLPYALITAMVLYRAAYAVTGAARRADRPRFAYAPLVLTAVLALVLTPAMLSNVRDMELRAAHPYFFPTPPGIFAKLEELTRTGDQAVVLADQDLSVTLPAYVARANVLAHRVPTTSEVFPADQQVDALQRLIDQDNFYRSRYLTEDAVAILRRYDVDYVVTPAGSNIDIQLRAAPQWFTWVTDDQSYSLYAVGDLPASTPALQGNTAMAQRLWQPAEAHYRAALAANPHDVMAILGLAEIAHAQGEFTDAVSWLRAAMIHSREPSLQYRLGQIFTEMGRTDRSLAAYEAAHRAAPQIARYSMALGDACLSAGNLDCADEQFRNAVANGNQTDAVAQMIALGDIWRQRSRPLQAIPLYEAAVAQHPSVDNRLMLASVYQEARRFPQAEALLDLVRSEHPLQVEPLVLLGSVYTEASRFDEAVAVYQQALRLQQLTGQVETETRISLAQTLLRAGRYDQATAQLDRVLATEPYNAIAYGMQGDLLIRQRRPDDAIQAFQHAFRLDPTEVGIYVSLTNQLRQQGGRQDDVLELLERAIKANPDEAMLALAFGDQAERRGEVQLAVDAYQSALDMFERNATPGGQNPRITSVSRAYAFARLAGVSEDKGALEPAMNYYNAAVAAAPALPWPHVILGDALRRRGDVDGARAAYEAAIAADSDHADAYMHLSNLYTAMGDTIQAASYRDQAYELVVADPGQQLSSGRMGLSSITPAASTAALPATYGSDETLAQADATGQAQATTPTVAPTSLNLNEMDEANLRLLARIYREGADAEQAAAFYDELIRAGERRGWYSTVMSEYHKGLGDIYLTQDDPAGAITQYSDAVELDDSWPQPRLGLARALADQGLLDKALEELRVAVNIAPGYVEAQVALAGALEAAGETGDALAILEETAARHSGNANATLAYARALQNRGELDKAEAILRDTVALNAGNADAQVALAALLIERARYDEARPYLDAALRVDHENVNAYIQSGVLEQQLGNPTEALAWFNKAIDLRVDSPAVSVTLIDQLQRSAHYEPALAYIQERLEKQPENLDLLLRQATIQRMLGRYSDAMVTLLRAEDQGLSDAGLAAELGELHAAQGRLRPAIAAYQQAITLQPDERGYYLRTAELWRLLGDYDKARATLELGTTRAIEPAALYVAIADLEQDRGNRDAALAVLESARDALPDSREVLLAKGAYLELSNVREAERWYADLAALYSEDASVHVAMGAFLLERSKYDEALVHLTKATELNPQDAALFGLLGHAYNTAGNKEKALAAYEHALALEPTQIDTYTDLAALYEALGNVDAARAAFTRGMQVAPTNGQFYIAYVGFLLKHGDRNLAQSMLADADRLAPTASMLVARAALYQAQGQVQNAETDLRTAIEQAPGAIEAYIALSNLYQQRGDSRRAQQIIDAAETRIPGLRATAGR